jgi:ribonucleoside-diphosphate reductase alpha chain
MYLHAWKQGLKTTYYLRSRPATRIAATTTGGAAPPPPRRIDRSDGTVPAPAVVDDGAAVSCSLESPETCEACD